MPDIIRTGNSEVLGFTAIQGQIGPCTANPSLDAKQSQDNSLLASRGWGRTSSAGGGAITQAPVVIPVTISGAWLPKKEDYIDSSGAIQQEWFRDCALYCIRDSRTVIDTKLASYRTSMESVTRMVDTQYPADTMGLGGGGMDFQYVNIISPLIDILQGEFAATDVRIRCHVTNPASHGRKKQAETDLLYYKLLKGVGVTAQEMQQMGLPNGEEILKDFEGDVKLYMEQGYKDTNAQVAESLIKDFMARTNFKDWLNQVRKRYLLTDAAHADPYIDPETLELVNPLVNPLSFIADPICNDNFFEGAKFSVRLEYVRQEEAIRRFPNLSIEDIQAGVGFTGLGFTADFFLPQSDNINYVLITYVNFIYPEEEKVKRTVEVASKITEIGQEVELEEQEVLIRYEEMYFCTLIGGQLVAQCGKVPFQCRSSGNLARAVLNSTSLVYDNSLSQTAPSKMMRLLGLANYANRILFELIDQVSRMNGPLLKVRISKIPSLGSNDVTTNLKAFLYHIKSDRIILEEDAYSPEDQDPRPAVEAVNLTGDTISEINGRIAAFELIQRQIRNLAGVSEARVGQTGQYQTSAAAIQNKTQSDYATQDRDKAFESWTSRLLTKIVNLAKIRLREIRNRAEEGDAYCQYLIEAEKARIGDNVMLLTEDGLLVEDYGIEIQQGRNDEALNSKLDDMLMLAVQQKTDPRLVFGAGQVLLKDSPEAKLEALRRLTANMEAMQAEAAKAEAEAAQTQPKQPAPAAQ